MHGHIEGATHIAMGDVPARLDDLPEGDPLYVTCRGGGRSARVAAWLNQNGFDAVNVGRRHGRVGGRRPPHGERDRRAPLRALSRRPELRRRACDAWRDEVPQFAGYSANRVRRSFFENLPTLVLGTSSMNSTCSGSHHLATSGLRWSRMSSSVAVSPSLRTTQASGRSSHFGSGMPIDRGLLHRRVAHDRVLQVDRADPLAAGLDQVLGAVGDPDRAVGVHRGDVAGLHPAVLGGELHAGVGVVVVLRAPRAAHLQLAGGLVVPRLRLEGVGVDDPRLDAEERDAGAGPLVGLRLVVGVLVALRQHAGRRDRVGLGHAPAPAGSGARPARGRPRSAPWAPPSRRSRCRGACAACRRGAGARPARWWVRRR